MKLGMTIEEATEVMQWALSEPVGCIVYTSDQPYIMQVLYRARRIDPEFEDIHVGQRSEGLILWHIRNKGVLW